MIYTLAFVFVICAIGTHVRYDLRDDGVPVVLLDPEEVQAEFTSDPSDYPPQKFSDKYVKKALSATVDWRKKGAVTPVKDQGPHGYCGTFGRVQSAEGQFVLRGNRSQREFSIEQLIECVGWSNNQTSSFIVNGFMSEEDYPYDISKYPDKNPPIPGHPCRFDKSKVIKHSMASNRIRVPASYGEDQFAAFIYHNGPVSCGLSAQMFQQADKDNFVTKEGCKKSTTDLDHSILVVGYGVDSEKGPYWLIKNSWGANWKDHGYIKIARGVACGHFGEVGCGVYTYGDPAHYYP